MWPHAKQALGAGVGVAVKASRGGATNSSEPGLLTRGWGSELSEETWAPNPHHTIPVPRAGSH